MTDILMMAARQRKPVVPVAPELLRVEQVAMMTELGTRTIWALVAKGEFPNPLRIGQSRRWRRSDVMRWIDGLDQE